MYGWMDGWMDGRMHGCMHACMHACMYVCNVCMYACLHACMHLFLPVSRLVCPYWGPYAFTYAGRFACMYVCMYVCMFAGMHACMRVCVYVCMQTCIEKDICIRDATFTQPQARTCTPASASLSCHTWIAIAKHIDICMDRDRWTDILIGLMIRFPTIWPWGPGRGHPTSKRQTPINYKQNRNQGPCALRQCWPLRSLHSIGIVLVGQRLHVPHKKWRHRNTGLGLGLGFGAWTTMSTGWSRETPQYPLIKELHSRLKESFWTKVAGSAIERVNPGRNSKP